MLGELLYKLGLGWIVSVCDRAVSRLLRWRRGKYGEVVRIEVRDLSKSNVWRLATRSVITDDDLQALRQIGLSNVHDWLITNKGAFISGERRDDLMLTGAWQGEVIVDEIMAIVERRSTAPAGALVDSPPAGAREAVLVGFDLTDGAESRAVVVQEDGGLIWTKTPYFPSHSVNLKPEEHQPLTVVSRTGNDTVWWRLKLKVKAGKQAREVFYPPQDEAPLVTSCVSADQYWMTGVASGGKPPWLRPATDQEISWMVPSEAGRSEAGHVSNTNSLRRVLPS